LGLAQWGWLIGRWTYLSDHNRRDHDPKSSRALAIGRSLLYLDGFYCILCAVQLCIEMLKMDESNLPNDEKSPGGDQDRPVHSFAENVSETRCPNCDEYYSRAGLAGRLQSARLQPKTGQKLRIKCRKCGHLADFVFEDNWPVPPREPDDDDFPGQGICGTGGMNDDLF